MSTEVVMPQMGESIAEGTIVRWLKKVGDAVERDEPLFEISTDKVDAEIPSPAAGTVAEIRVKEGETVAVNSVVAVIGTEGQASAQPAAEERVETKPAAAPAPPPAAAPRETAPPAPPPSAPAARAGSAEPQARALRERSSPLVRRIAKEHNVDITRMAGTGINGRVTKADILAFIAGTSKSARAEAPAGPAAGPAPGDVVPMSVMRRKIAEHMIESRRTSAHVHSVFEVNFNRVDEIRRARKAEYERAGVKVTYLSFILKAVADALRAVPVINASVDGDNVVYHQSVNIGVAVALDWGLIVPVIKDADALDLVGLSRTVADLAARARQKQLKPDDVAGGTFTVTNPGGFGALFGMPIINQPQLAILGVGGIEKRVVVVDDAIAIRPTGYLTLGFDHRIIDGAVADQFMAHVKRSIEGWDPAGA
jgi:2-oxoglutarate dehydrogenase E2 component (dihydrolipoamide succinyltransferase)